MMTPSETIELLKNIGCTEIYVVCIVRDLETVEDDLKKIRNLGYAAYLRTTAMGNEIVVTEKVNDGPIGSSRTEIH